MLKLKNIQEIIFIIVGVVLLLTLVVLISLVGKNLTYSRHFTPPSTEQDLKDQTFFTQSQVLMVTTGSFLILLVPAFTFTAFLQKKRMFVPMWGVFVGLSIFLMLLAIYNLMGSGSYREYLGQVSNVIEGSPGYCQTSMCNKATCARMSSFSSSRTIVEVFLGLGSISSMLMAYLGFRINLARRKNT